jgi:hypothetical protein
MAADDDKKMILARRAKFVAAALAGVSLAGVSVACGKEPTQPPQPCLSQPMDQRDAEPVPPPQPCLSPMPYNEDAGPSPIDAGAPADAGGGATTRSLLGDAGTAPPKPTPCLAPPLPTNTGTTKPPPRPCLSIVKPPDKEGR